MVAPSNARIGQFLIESTILALAGGLIGNQLARGKSATLGTILGAGAGALIGQAIEKDSVYCE